MSFWSFGVGIWSHFTWYRFPAAEEFSHLLMRQSFSTSEISGLQAGQFSTRTLLLRSHDVVIATVCGFALSCWNRCHPEGSICCSKTFIYLSAFIVPSKTCKLPIPYAPPYHQRCWLLNWTLITRWKVSLLFSLEDMVSGISNKNLDSSDHRTL